MSRIAQQAWWAIAPPAGEPDYYDDAVDSIIEEIWEDDELLLAAVRDSGSNQTIEMAVGRYAVWLLEQKREKE